MNPNDGDPSAHGPDLSKRTADVGADHVAGATEPPDSGAIPGAPASIWQPLDGSAPRLPQVDPLVSAWGRPHQASPAAGNVAAAYVAASVPGGGSSGASGVFTLAGWGQRLGAFLIDSLLFGLAGLAIALPLGLWQGLTVNEAIQLFGLLMVPETVADPVPLYVAVVVQRLIVGLIPAFYLAYSGGQTPGKRALGIRVMRADGAALDLSTALRRELLGRTIIVNGLGFITVGVASLVNYLWPLWDPQRRTGHDAIGGTRVVSAPRE